VSELQVGDILRDNDPRMSYERRLRVVAVSAEYVDAQEVHLFGGLGRVMRYLRRRIHTDGRERKSGLSRVTHKA
jgi:hypothetical protein